MFIKKLCFGIIVIMYIANKCKALKLFLSNREKKEKFISHLNNLFEECLLEDKYKWLLVICLFVLVAIDVLLFYGVGFFDILFQ